MIEKLKHKYALSENGAKNMIKAFVAVTIANLVLIFAGWASVSAYLLSA